MRDAVFLCITFFFTALSIADIAFFIDSAASFALPAVIKERVSLVADLCLKRVRWLIAALRRDWRIALLADLVLGIQII